MRKKVSFFISLFGMFLFLGAGCISLTGGSQAQGPAGLYRSLDKGDSWQQIVSYPTTQGVKSLAGVNVYRVYTDSGDANVMYLTTRGQGVFYTLNNGDSWQQMDFFAGQFIYALAVDPRNPCVLYVGDGSGKIFKTASCGRYWQVVYTEGRVGQRAVSLAVDAQDSRTVYAALLNGDILTSHDAGVSWEVVNRFGINVQELVVDPLAPHRLYVATYQNGLYRSDDGGVNWTALDEGMRAYNDSMKFYRLVLHPTAPDTVFWLSKYGILRSNDAGKTWTDLKLLTPPGSVNIYTFGINPQNSRELYYTGTILGDKNAHVRSTFYKSVDGGATWVTKKLPTNTIPVFIRIHPDKTNVLFMGFTSAQ